MTVASAKPRPSRKRPARSAGPPSVGWWGDGPPPWERWAGVTIKIASVWVAERGRWESPDGVYWFDPEAAALAVDFFPEFLVHHKGEFAGQPFRLLDYQDLLIIRPLFGWKRTSDNLRRFRKVFLAVPKGNGKSPLGAGTGLLLTFCDREEGAEVYSAAADKDQASIVFSTAKIMVEENPDLLDQSVVLRNVIEVPSTHSYYRVLSAESRTKHGPNIHGLIFDEFHAQPTRDLYEILYRGTVKRRQPVTFMITTAGDDDESICAEEWEYARKVINGPAGDGTDVDATYLPVIFEASKDEDWKSEAVWRRVNPGFGITVKADAIAAECIAAQQEPRKLNDFLRYHMNRWVNQATAWIPIDWWDACEGALPANLLSLPVHAGLDLAQKNDLASFVCVFLSPLPEPIEVKVITTDEDLDGRATRWAEPVERTISLNYEIILVPHFWIPEDTMREHEKEDRVPYAQWANAGLVTATQGNVIDYDRILRDITGPITARFPLLRQGQIGYDPAFATDLAIKLQGKGYQMVEVMQNYQRMSEPAHVFEAFVKGGRVRHDGHRVLRWNMENVAVRSDDAGRIRPVKSRKRAKRIDGVVAALMGLGRAIVQPATPAAPSVWVIGDDE